MATLCVPSSRERSKGLGVEVGGSIASWHAPSVAFQRARAAALAEPLRLEEVHDAPRRHQTLLCSLVGPDSELVAVAGDPPRVGERSRSAAILGCFRGCSSVG